MKLKTAITVALTLSGKYNHPTNRLTVNGYDAYGKEVTETIPEVDGEALARDVQAIMDGKMPMPLRSVDRIVVTE